MTLQATEDDHLPEQFGTGLAARLLGCSRSTVVAMCRRGELPHRLGYGGRFKFSARTWRPWFATRFVAQLATPATSSKTRKRSVHRPLA